MGERKGGREGGRERGERETAMAKRRKGSELFYHTNRRVKRNRGNEIYTVNKDSQEGKS